MGALSNVVLAVSSYRSSEEVLHMLRTLAANGGLEQFGAVLVLDSQGENDFGLALSQIAKSIQYRNVPDRNIGSAGNLSQRLEWASTFTSCDWVFALNHDGQVSTKVVADLLTGVRDSKGPIGAVFPARRFTRRGDSFAAVAKNHLALGWWQNTPTTGVVRTTWSSSNGALYNLAPVRDGITPPSEFWMGWEDLAYGWMLEQHGYEQYIVSDVVLDDDYEFRRIGPESFRLYVSDKAPWYEYYFARNLLLTAKTLRKPLRAVAGKLVLEAVMIGLIRPEKRERATHYIAGVTDFFRGVDGKGPVPA